MPERMTSIAERLAGGGNWSPASIFQGIASIIRDNVLVERKDIVKSVRRSVNKDKQVREYFRADTPQLAYEELASDALLAMQQCGAIVENGIGSWKAGPAFELGRQITVIDDLTYTLYTKEQEEENRNKYLPVKRQSISRLEELGREFDGIFSKMLLGASDRVIALGGILIEAKKEAGHWNWRPWLRCRGISETTARRWMGHFNQAPEDVKCAILAHFLQIGKKKPASEKKQQAIESKKKIEVFESRLASGENKDAALEAAGYVGEDEGRGALQNRRALLRTKLEAAAVSYIPYVVSGEMTIDDVVDIVVCVFKR